MFVVGDVIEPRDLPYESPDFSMGEVFFKGKWHMFTFDREALFLIVDVERDDPNGFLIDIIDLDNGWRFKYRGVPEVFIKYCSFI